MAERQKYMKKYRKNNEKMEEQIRRWQNGHPDDMENNCKKWREENSEAYKTYQKKWRSDNREKYNELMKNLMRRRRYAAMMEKIQQISRTGNILVVGHNE